MEAFDVKPIRPEELSVFKKFPDAVIRAFNQLIIENYNGRWAIFSEASVIDRIISLKGCARSDVFASGWLNIEQMYQEAGWNVKYERSEIGCHAMFTFTEKEEKV